MTQQKHIKAGPLLQFELMRLSKLLLLNDPVSFTVGDEQVIHMKIGEATVVIGVRMIKEALGTSQTYTTLEIP